MMFRETWLLLEAAEPVDSKSTRENDARKNLPQLIKQVPWDNRTRDQEQLAVKARQLWQHRTLGAWPELSRQFEASDQQ